MILHRENVDSLLGSSNTESIHVGAQGNQMEPKEAKDMQAETLNLLHYNPFGVVPKETFSLTAATFVIIFHRANVGVFMLNGRKRVPNKSCKHTYSLRHMQTKQAKQAKQAKHVLFYSSTRFLLHVHARMDVHACARARMYVTVAMLL